MKRKVNEVRAGAVISYITLFFNVASGLLYTPWLMNSLGDSDYAIYILVTSIMGYFVLDFGMGASITRFISKYRSTDEPDKIYNLLGVTTKIYLTIDFVILASMAVFWFFIDKIYVNLSPSEITNLEYVFIIAGFIALLSFPLLPVNGVYTAYEKLYAQKIFDLIAKVLTVASVVVSLLIGGGLFEVVFFNTGISFATNLAKLIYIRKKEKITINWKYKDKALTKQIFSFSLWIMLASIADRFFFTFIPSILGIVSNSTEIAIFSVAVSVENYTCLFASVFNNLFLPRVTKMVVANENPEKITDLMIKVGRIQLVVVSAIVTAIVSMGNEFIRCWVGESKSDAYLVLIIILLPTLVHFCQAIGTEMIYATGNVKYRALVYICGSVLSTAVTFIIGGRLGAIGAAIGIASGLILSHIVLLNIIYRKKLQLNVLRYFKECQLKIALPLILSGVIGFFIQSIYPVSSLFLFILKAGVWGICYAVIIWFMFLNKYEKSLFIDLAKKISQPLLKRIKFLKKDVE